ncbi:TPA: hypothetical protein M2P26_002155 [Klebsiella variicola]|nr:hypothetical protein [Klebsiella variicola]
MTSKFDKLSINISDYSTAYARYWDDLETIISRLENEIVSDFGVPNSNVLVVDGKVVGKYVTVGIKGKVQQVSAVDPASPKEMHKDRDKMDIAFALAISIDVSGHKTPVGNYFDVRIHISNKQFVFNFYPRSGDDFEVCTPRGVAGTVSLEKVYNAIFEFINKKYDFSKLE